MRRKLSHAGAGPIAALCFVGALLAACNEVEARDEGQAHSKAAKPPASPFEWPVDPSHPVLELEVEWGDQSGRIRIELMPELAPATVVKVVELADAGFYDGTTFHRVIPDFMIQGGDPNSRDRDPTNDGRGASGAHLPDETGRAPFLRGVVGMGNKGRADSTSTQFFIMHADNQNLDGRYTAIGRVFDGIEWVDAIAAVETDQTGRWGPRDRPIENVVMKQVRSIGQLASVSAPSKVAADRPVFQPEATTRAERAPPPGPASPAMGEEWERLEAMAR